MGVSVDVTVKGPLADGRATRAVHTAVGEIQETAANQLLEAWMQNANSSFVTQTPYYLTQATVQHAQDQSVVHDRGVVYGGWLERGNTKTRFRGYHSLARAVTTVKAGIGRLAGQLIAKHLRGA